MDHLDITIELEDENGEECELTMDELEDDLNPCDICSGC